MIDAAHPNLSAGSEREDQQVRLRGCYRAEFRNVAVAGIVAHAVQAAAVEDQREGFTYPRRAQAGRIGPQEVDPNVFGGGLGTSLLERLRRDVHSRYLPSVAC